METQKILKPNNKIIVLADYREHEIIEQLENLGVKVNKMNLEIGDFICSDNRIVIERKAHSDFVSSIIDGRIFQQLKYLKENFEKPVVIVEGYSNRQININAIRATIASLITKFNISFINTKNKFDTASMIYWLARKEQESGYDLGFKQGKKPKELSDIQEFVVSSLPGISTVLAKRLLKKFNNIENIINASETELEKIRGIGRNQARRIKKLLTAKYSRVFT